jgi:hypothetical protein
MTADNSRELGLCTDARYRTVGEARIIEQLLHFGFAFEVMEGQRATAQRAAAVALQRWVERGLGFAMGVDAERRFDPAEVMNFARWLGHSECDDFWVARMVATSRKSVLSLHDGGGAPTGMPSPDALAPRSFHVTLRRDFDLGRQPVGSRLLLRVPLPLEDDALTDLRVVPIIATDRKVDFNIAPGRLDVRLASAGTTVQIGFDATFNARPHATRTRSPRLSPSDTVLYTKGKEGLIRVTPHIRTLAAALSGTANDAESSVRAFWSYLIDTSRCGVLHYDELIGRDATDCALDTQWMDCQLASAVFVALCRANAIPARLVSGYLLYASNATYHYWAEVWLDPSGWRPYDFLCNDLSLRGRDVAWRDYFAGHLDYRMKTQCLPRLFDYNPAAPFPDVWHMLSRLVGAATETSFHATATGALIYRDTVEVRTPLRRVPAA